MEKLDLIVNLLNDNRADVKDIKEDISEMKIDVALNKEDLKNHMTQTIAVTKIATDNKAYFDKKIEEIENKLTVTYILKVVVTIASGIGVVAGAI